MAANGHVTIFIIIGSNGSFIYCESSTAIGLMVLEILFFEPIYPQYSGVLETCLALRHWFFEVLGSESVNVITVLVIGVSSGILFSFHAIQNFTTRYAVYVVQYDLILISWSNGSILVLLHNF